MNTPTHGGSQIWLEPGEQFTLDEMLKAICVSSANDAAVAVAELVGGSEPAFVQQMTPAPQSWAWSTPPSATPAGWTQKGIFPPHGM